MTAAVVEAFSAGQDGVPEAGQLVQVRGQQWVVSAVSRSQQPVDELAAAALPGQTLVRLTSVSDDDLGGELTVVWEVEPGREIVPATKLPEVTGDGWDDPQRLGAFLDAVRWARPAPSSGPTGTSQSTSSGLDQNPVSPRAA